MFLSLDLSKDLKMVIMTLTDNFFCNTKSLKSLFRQQIVMSRNREREFFYVQKCLTNKSWGEECSFLDRALRAPNLKVLLPVVVAVMVVAHFLDTKVS